MRRRVPTKPAQPDRRPAVILAAALAALAQTASAAQVAGDTADTAFALTSPLSSNLEMARRLLTPLMAAALPRRVARAGKALAEQPVDPARERFALHVPPSEPPAGYGLLVFVPPWPEATVPSAWVGVLDRFGIIFVSAGRSGNDQSVLGRREPLALLAAANVLARYRVDPERVYVGGLSGGSRVALRLALGYPDLFRGALLNAGSDPIGDGDSPIPPRDLFALFQARSRLVYLTGGDDAEHLAMDTASLASMREACVFDTQQINPPGVGHTLAAPEALARALTALQAPAAGDPARLAQCRARIEQDLTKRLDEAEALLASGHKAAAAKVVDRIDRRFGGLAAPRNLDLAARAAAP